MKKKVRLGIIGVGGMGGCHARDILEGKVRDCELTAVCDFVPAVLDRFPGINTFTDHTEMMLSGLIDAVLIATPHLSHANLGIAALKHGLHVLVEKPISVDKASSERLIAAHTNPNQVFSAMFNMRAEPRFAQVHRMIRSGELGEIRRINWIVTDWFRPDAYYKSGAWRATWAGDGGGLLMNQCPHNLDVIQWLFGMPHTVRGFCHIGKYHDIEVEDDVTAYFEYREGATAVFIASTGEAPGTNRLEISCDNGRLLVEQDEIVFTRNAMPASEYSRTTSAPYSRPETAEVRIPLVANTTGHVAIMQNFVNAILHGEPLIAPAKDGIHSVELANAIVYSSFLKKSVQLPMDAAAYAVFLEDKMRTSRFHKSGRKPVVASSPSPTESGGVGLGTGVREEPAHT